MADTLQSQGVHERDDETQPLLGRHEDPTTDSTGQHTPLPYLQFLILCYLRILDPLNFTQILPYVNELVLYLGVTDDPKQVATYSGMVEGVFLCCQLVAFYPWGWLSDNVGRRPVILAGTLGLSVATVFFGFSKSFVSVLAARAVSGLFSGNIAVLPTAVIKVTNDSNQETIMSVFGIWWPLGAIIGPLIGGTFANPTKRFPGLFGNNTLFRNYPYLLPCLFAAGMNCIGLIPAVQT
ncbi:hypothetical protein D9758_001659 [Tetrapyrgos nigripes]|uniref:Major facilitator superfamily (MFS) profile domain-containing protein n=1 Tax=Tetrapyrgos nigripes TaxID=182062 RepID=A0A8H5GXT3_9AGAR|nr:hypothetical protein D9758_001659 [Tetrapyrgos nigripes]